MKILIAYDGSECASSALDDLIHAGLPADAEVMVLSVSEIVLPPPMTYTLPAPGAIELQKALQNNALKMAEHTCERLKKIIPDGKFHAEAHTGSPGYSVISAADEWKPDLIVVGSHGRSRLGRLFLGSVSQAVLTEADCSVRIGRRHDEIPRPHGTPVRILIAVDGSERSIAAIEAVAARRFPRGSEIRLVNADYTVPSETEGHLIAPLADWVSDERSKVIKIIETARERFHAKGWHTSTLMKEADPKHLILEEAENWQADCIFLGAKGHGALTRLRLGSVSYAVAARAHCTVEVVRIRESK